MGVVVEALHEPLADVLVDERVVGDFVHPLVELGLGGQFTVDEQVCHLEVGRVLRQVLNGVPPVAQDAVLAVEFGDGALCCGGGGERRVEEPGAGEEFGPLAGVHTSVVDRDLDALAGAVVGDGH